MKRSLPPLWTESLALHPITWALLLIASSYTLYLRSDTMPRLLIATTIISLLMLIYRLFAHYSSLANLGILGLALLIALLPSRVKR